MVKEFKLETLQEDLLLSLHTKYPNTIDDNARFFVEDLRYEKGKAHGCIYSGKAEIINQIKGIELDFDIWFDVYCEAYAAPDVEPTIETYLTGQYAKIQKVRSPVPEMGLKTVILLNVPEIPPWDRKTIQEKRHFDAYWHVFEVPKGNKILSKEGWFETYVYDAKLGMRPTTDDDWVDLKDGWRKIKEGLEMVRETEAFKNPVKEFIMKKYYEKINPEMYVEL